MEGRGPGALRYLHPCVCVGGGGSPMTRDLEVASAVLRVRRMGCSREKQRAGAATLEIHMEANMATNMLASSTFAGFCPTCNM